MRSVVSARSGIAARSLSTSAEIALPAVRAPHRLQDPRRPGLERKVNVLADRIALRHRGDHGISEVLRMRAREADPVDAVHSVQRAQKLAELRRELGGEVAAPGVHVLAEERHLADAVARERGDLRDDVARPSALLPAAHRGDDAVGALRVAAHRDLHPRLKASLPPGRQVGRELLPLGEPSRAQCLRRPRRPSPRGARSSLGRRPRPPRDRARRCARAVPPRSSRRPRSPSPGLAL